MVGCTPLVEVYGFSVVEELVKTNVDSMLCVVGKGEMCVIIVVG